MNLMLSSFSVLAKHAYFPSPHRFPSPIGWERVSQAGQGIGRAGRWIKGEVLVILLLLLLSPPASRLQQETPFNSAQPRANDNQTNQKGTFL